jgi:hypothetical protein
MPFFHPEYVVQQRKGETEKEQEQAERLIEPRRKLLGWNSKHPQGPSLLHDGPQWRKYGACPCACSQHLIRRVDLGLVLDQQLRNRLVTFQGSLHETRRAVLPWIGEGGDGM